MANNPIDQAKNQAQSLKNAAVAAVTGQNSSPGTPSPGPWFKEKSDNAFFNPIKLDGDRWDKLFPYRLVVWDAKNKQIVSSGSSQNFKLKADGSIYRIVFEPMANSWIFKLPITPQQYSVSTQFTATVTATQRGIVEEHNGIKFKLITCGGSMGVWPSRPNLNSPPSSPTPISTLFGGTIQAAQSLTGQIQRLVNTATTNHPASAPTETPPKGGFLESTGYYQALLLDQFLEQYSEAKKKPENRHWRLVFDIPKENQSYIVTPLDFAYSKSADSPNEVKFRFQLKAWRRVNLNDKTPSIGFPELKLTPDLISKTLNSIEQFRRTISSFYNLIRAVRSDFNTIFNSAREAAVFLKDFAGIPVTLADLPTAIIQDGGDTLSAIKDAYKPLTESGPSALSQFSLKGEVNSEIQKSLKQIKQSSNKAEGIPFKSVEDGQLGSGAQVAISTDPSNQPFQTPEKSFDLLNLLSSSNINFSASVQDQINSDLQNIRNITVDDLIAKRELFLELALQVSNAFGSGDQTYSEIYSKPDPYQRIQDMTIDEFAILNSIYDLVQNLDSITATNEFDNDRIQNAFEFVGSLAANSEIPFENSVAKIRLPVPYGLNMEQISARYLGNPDRWIEIATLNSLRSPYIDEDGFFYELLSNADGRQFNIISNINLFIGQKIVLSSLTQPQTTRRITNIEKISSTNYLITVDGLDNLDNFTIADGSKMRAYLPGTINSQDQIFVPSNVTATDTVLSRPVSATKGDPLVGLSKIDWLLTDSGDIATDAYGDFRLSFGLTNLTQALKMKFATPSNRLLKHPDYGAGLTPGVSTADLNSQDAITNIIKSIQNDPRYGDILNLTVRKTGPTFEVSLAVSLADGSGVFPLNFVLNS